MLRVIIAEDEELIREGLNREIPWGALGLEVVGLAANGREAAELCRTRKPDILLTDIRMPIVDGLELIRQVRESDPGVTFLIISGYDDFHYAQRAIQLGVSDYFIKPLELDRMQSRLEEIRARIEQERERAEREERAQELLKDVSPYLKRHLLVELLYNPDEGEGGEIARRLARLGFLEEEGLAAAVLVEVRGRGAGSGLLRGDGYRGEDIYLLKGSEEAALFVVVLGGGTAPELARRVEAYVRELGRLGRVVRAAAGGVQRGIRGLPASFAAARRRLILLQLCSDCGADADALPPERAGAAPEGAGGAGERVLEEALRAGEAGRLEELLERIGAQVADPRAPDGRAKELLVELFRVLAARAEECGLNIESLARAPGPEAGRPGTPAAAAAGAAVTGGAAPPGAAADGAVFERLRRIAGVLAGCGSAKTGRPARNLIGQARQYIQRHLADWDLSLEEVAESLQLNPSYFSAVFKAAEGVNYIEYVTRQRLERAKELLGEGQLKISAVAQRVGYQNPAYFDYLFKKRFRLTPTEYRARLAAGGEANLEKSIPNP